LLRRAGKTAVCAAVCLANPASRKVVSYSKNNPRCTVVLVHNTLVGQWTDELRKFAPHLKLGRGYGSRRAFTQEYLDSIDVLVTTPHSGLGLGRKTSSLGGDVVGHVRRLVLDESHLYEKGAEPKMPTTKVFTQWRAKFVWCVTGTPFSTQLVQLETQARILGQWEGGFKLSTILAGSPYQSSVYKSNDEVVDMLREVMIRHSKSQRIKGEVALALPESECNTAWVTFSRSEQVLYALHGCADGVPALADANRHNLCTIDDVAKGLSNRRRAAAHMYSERAVTGDSAKKHCTLSRPAAGQLRPRAVTAFREIGYGCS